MSSSAIPIGEFSHVVGTSDGTTLNIYINGVNKGSIAAKGAIDISAYDLWIGRQDYYFNGSIDGVKIYNRALSAEEVRYHYNRGGPVAHWKFDEGSGQYARDAVGNAHAQLGSDVTSDGDPNDPTWSR